MAIYIATLLRIEAESNPDSTTVRIEAKDLAAARKQAEEILKGELRGLGWTSYADPALWGKEQRMFVDVVTEEEHLARTPESQAEREARLREAAKV